MHELIRDRQASRDDWSSVLAATLVHGLTLGSLCVALSACAPIELQAPTQGDLILNPTESGYPMVATEAVASRTASDPSPIALDPNPYPGLEDIDTASPTPNPPGTEAPQSTQTETPRPTPAGTPTVMDDGVWTIVGGSRILRYDHSHWQKTFLSGLTPTIGVLQFWGEGLVHRQIEGCLMGENLGRGLIGTEIEIQDGSRTFFGQDFSVREFQVDGRVQPYAVVGTDIGVEYPQDPEACWQDAGAVLVTEEIVTSTAQP